MLDRRQRFRGRVYYGGAITFNERNSTMDCLVRNFSPFGAKVEFENTALLPDEIDFTIHRKSFSWLARVVWRQANEAGLVFRNPKNLAAPIPIDWAVRLRDGDRARKALEAKVEQLRSE